MHNPLPDEYETLADQYDTSFQLAYRTHVEAYSVMAALADVGGVTERHVLDVACGTGHYARQFRRAGAAQVVGVDLSPEMIRVARQAEQDTPLGALTYHVADAGALTRYGTFDLAVAVYLFHYAQSQAHLTRMCQGIAQNLRSGGTFVTYGLHPNLCTDPDYYAPYGVNVFAPPTLQDGAVYHFAFRMQETWTPQIPVYFWSFAAMEQALHAAGFETMWRDPGVSPAGMAQHGADFWRPYLTAPHCTLLIAHKP